VSVKLINSHEIVAAKMKEKFKRLGTDSIVYALGIIMSKGIGFLLLPVYTRLFSPQGYGIIEILSSFGIFLGAFIATGMNGSQAFYFFKARNDGSKEQAKILGAALQWRIIWGGILSLMMFAASPVLTHYLFLGQVPNGVFLAAVTGVFLAQLTNHSVEVLRLLYRPWGYIAISILEGVLSAILGIVLVISFHMGIAGYFIGLLLGSLITVGAGLWQTRKYLDFSTLHVSWWPSLLRFGFPLLLSGFATYVLYNADRWLINYYLGGSALGVYAIGAKFGMIILVVINSFRQAVWPIALDIMHTPEGPEFLRVTAQGYMGCGAMLAVVVTTLSPFLVTLFAAAPFHNAYPLVGILCWCPILYGFIMISGSGIWKAERTKITPGIALCSAAANILMALLLVPTYGLNGAAIATVLSFVVWNILTLYFSERLWHVGYPVVRLVVQMACGMVATVFIIWLYGNNHSLWSVFGMTMAGLVTIAVASLSSQEMIHNGKRYLTHFLLGT